MSELEKPRPPNSCFHPTPKNELDDNARLCASQRKKELPKGKGHYKRIRNLPVVHKIRDEMCGSAWFDGSCFQVSLPSRGLVNLWNGGRKG